MEQKTQMEITFNLFTLSMNAAQLHALKKFFHYHSLHKIFMEYLKPASLTVRKKMHLIYTC